MPAVRLVREIAVLRADPQRAIAECDRRHLSEMVPLPQPFPVQIEPLQPGIVPIRHIDDPPIVHRNPVRLVELSGPCSVTAPLPDALALCVVFEDARVPVAIRNIDPAIRSERNVTGPVCRAAARRL